MLWAKRAAHCYCWNRRRSGGGCEDQDLKWEADPWPGKVGPLSLLSKVSQPGVGGAVSSTAQLPARCKVIPGAGPGAAGAPLWLAGKARVALAVWCVLCILPRVHRREISLRAGTSFALESPAVLTPEISVGVHWIKKLGNMFDSS